MPQPWAPRCCFEQHQKRMKRIRVNVDTEGLHTRWDAHTNTGCIFFPKDNDTNKMAYISQKIKRPKTAQVKSCCDVLLTAELYVHQSCSYLQDGQEFHFFQMKMWESISIYAGRENARWLFSSSASCVRVCSISLSVCRTRLLTQHSRPHTLDRLFSPILVEVLQREAEKKDRMRLREQAKIKLKAVRLLGAMYWAIRGEPSGDLLPLTESACQSVSGATVTQQLHRLSGWPVPVPSHCWHFHTSDKSRARPPWAEMVGWIEGWGRWKEVWEGNGGRGQGEGRHGGGRQKKQGGNGR